MPSDTDLYRIGAVQVYEDEPLMGAGGCSVGRAAGRGCTMLRRHHKDARVWRQFVDAQRHARPGLLNGLTSLLSTDRVMAGCTGWRVCGLHFELRDQFLRLERLDQIVVHSGFETGCKAFPERRAPSSL